MAILQLFKVIKYKNLPVYNTV